MYNVINSILKYFINSYFSTLNINEVKIKILSYAVKKEVKC